MIYNIRKYEHHVNASSRTLTTYIDLGKQFILTLPYPLMIFIDINERELYDTIMNERIRHGFSHLTYIYEMNIKDTYFYKDFKRLEELQKKFTIINGHLDHETPLYIIFNNNKFCFMEKTIELNPFSSTHFVWIDFGINHVAKNIERIHTWIDKVPDKIKQLCINPYLEPVEPKIYFTRIYHNCAGGLFSGSRENMLKYIQLFKQKTEQIYQEDWYQIDEAVMTMIQRENYDLFDYFYGDYEGIISNYLEPLHSWWLIRLGHQKCIDYNNTLYLYRMMIYMDYYFTKEENQLGDDFYNYIKNNIVCNYYHNSKQLRQPVVECIRSKHNDPIMIELLREQNNNLQFYENKHLLVK